MLYTNMTIPNAPPNQLPEFEHNAKPQAYPSPHGPSLCPTSGLRGAPPASPPNGTELGSTPYLPYVF